MALEDQICQLARKIEDEKNAAFDLWTWLPSYKVGQQHHGDHAGNFIPAVADIIREATLVLSQQNGFEVSKEDRKEWFEKCPCNEGCESK